MAADTKRGPLAAVLDIRRSEWPLALQMFGYFFLVITTFWVLKPIKKAIFVGYYDESGLDLWGWALEAAQAELIAKVLNMAVAFVAVVAFTAMSRRLRREKLTIAFCAFFVLTLAGYAFLVNSPSPTVVWSFYLYGDLYSTLMVATFFAFLNDSVTPSAAKRLYGLIVLGGVAGGAFGSSVLKAYIRDFDSSTWLWICLGVNAVIGALAWGAGAIVTKSEADVAASRAADAPPAPAPGKEGNAALEGARLVLRSPYLLSIVALVGLYEIVSTILDFQFTATVAHYLDGPEIGAQFATVYTITNVTSMIVQLVVTTFVMSRFRLTVALLLTPLIMLSASAAFLAIPILWVGSLLNTADNAFSYSINQSAREALYTPTSRDEKYKAKAFIDMFVQRFAKAIAVGVSLLITTIFSDFSSIRWLSLLVIFFVALWIVAARYGGARFRALSHEDER